MLYPYLQTDNKFQCVPLSDGLCIFTEAQVSNKVALEYWLEHGEMFKLTSLVASRTIPLFSHMLSPQRQPVLQVLAQLPTIG